jgi:hypothetical protein
MQCISISSTVFQQEKGGRSCIRRASDRACLVLGRLGFRNAPGGSEEEAARSHDLEGLRCCDESGSALPCTRTQPHLLQAVPPWWLRLPHGAPPMCTADPLRFQPRGAGAAVLHHMRSGPASIKACSGHTTPAPSHVLPSLESYSHVLRSSCYHPSRHCRLRTRPGLRRGGPLRYLLRRVERSGPGRRRGVWTRRVTAAAIS